MRYERSLRTLVPPLRRRSRPVSDVLPGWVQPAWTARDRRLWRAKLARLVRVPVQDVPEWEVEAFMRAAIAARARMAGTPQPPPKENAHD